jgi:hypothetical protein
VRDCSRLRAASCCSTHRGAALAPCAGKQRRAGPMSFKRVGSAAAAVAWAHAQHEMRGCCPTPAGLGRSSSSGSSVGGSPEVACRWSHRLPAPRPSSRSAGASAPSVSGWAAPVIWLAGWVGSSWTCCRTALLRGSAAPAPAPAPTGPGSRGRRASGYGRDRRVAARWWTRRRARGTSGGCCLKLSRLRP